MTQLVWKNSYVVNTGGGGKIWKSLDRERLGPDSSFLTLYKNIEE